MSNLLHIHQDTPQARHIKQAVEIIEAGGVIIYPTDTVYAFAGDLLRKSAVEKIAQIKQIKPEQINLSIMCESISQVAKYTKQIPDSTFQLMRKNLPGPVTFILQANNQVPKLFKNKKRTIGVRISNNNICQALIKELGRPLVSTSILPDEDDFYENDPDLVFDRYHKQIDLMLGGGLVPNTVSAVLDLTGEAIEIIRDGDFQL
jgi:tRNA threonylcarbamoyl adenosine modification protein (Sua5/YciO/YrdC/YwlC family)